MRVRKNDVYLIVMIAIFAFAPAVFAADSTLGYGTQCKAQGEPTMECLWLKALIRADILESLETIEASRDQRGTEEALEAVDLDDDPELQIAACRILGQFPETPGIGAKLPSLLFSPYVEVQRMAANVLSRNPDPALGALGSQWNNNHNSLPSKNDESWELPSLPSNYAKLGFPEYANTIRFPAADSDRSVGWATTESVPVVAANLSKKTGVALMSYQDWVNRTTQEGVKAVQSMDMSGMQEISKLTEQYVKTQDPKILEKIDAISKKMNEQGEKTGKTLENSVSSVVNNSGMMSQGNIQFLIAEEKQGRISRLIVVYSEPVFQLTVIQMIWDLTDYPKAWS